MPRGDGRPVVVVSGLGATDVSLSPLRGFLRRLGHDARAAGLGRISDDVEDLFPEIGRRCARLAQESGRRVAVVGWSIGGVLAREAARDHPAAIERVVTFGTPVEGGPSYTALAGRYTADELVRIRSRIEERNRIAIAVPVTSIWSRNDGVVTPEACIDRRTPTVEHVEVSSTHLGMGFDPDVWATVATRLATPADDVQTVA
jgi:pimeloyl-ACP methyl ester carboxylesterase